METNIVVLSLIVENVNATQKINEILHNYGEYVVGRMGIPYREKGVNIISVVMDAPQPIISAISGKLGMLEGVKSKVLTTAK